jgi:hypothetical protein
MNRQAKMIKQLILYIDSYILSDVVLYFSFVSNALCSDYDLYVSGSMLII